MLDIVILAVPLGITMDRDLPGEKRIPENIFNLQRLPQEY